MLKLKLILMLVLMLMLMLMLLLMLVFIFVNSVVMAITLPQSEMITIEEYSLREGMKWNERRWDEVMGWNGMELDVMG
jgi:hypothetical protein